MDPSSINEAAWPVDSEEARAATRSARVMTLLNRRAHDRMRDAAFKAKTAPQRLLWVQRAADLVVQAVLAAGAAACRRGCNHCCHIAVQVTQVEAEAIAKSTGRPMVKAPADALRPAEVEEWGGVKTALDASKRRSVAQYHGVRCPFLSSQGDCVVYEVRPLACRYHYNIGDDAEGCRLSVDGSEGPPANIFMLNNLTMLAGDALALGVHQPVADIREWFPTDSA
jgi:Fe-S-cluster containining protein